MSHRFLFAAALAAFVVSLPAAAPAVVPENPTYRVVCEPTETADMKVTIRRKVFSLLDADRSLRNKSVSVHLVTDKRYEYRTLSELTSGAVVSYDPASRAASARGDLLGHACLVDAVVSVTIGAEVRATGERWRGDPVRSQIRIPGNWAVKNRIDP